MAAMTFKGRLGWILLFLAVAVYSQNNMDCLAIVHRDTGAALKSLTFFDWSASTGLSRVLLYKFSSTMSIENMGSLPTELVGIDKIEPLLPRSVHGCVNGNYCQVTTSDSLLFFGRNINKSIVLYAKTFVSGQGWELSDLVSTGSSPMTYSYNVEEFPDMEPVVGSASRAQIKLSGINAGDEIALLAIGKFTVCMCGGLRVYFGANNTASSCLLDTPNGSPGPGYRFLRHRFTKDEDAYVGFHIRGAIHSMSTTMYSLLIFKISQTGTDVQLTRKAAIKKTMRKNPSAVVSMNGQSVKTTACRSPVVRNSQAVVRLAK
jgi:hypothetical protein